VAYTTRAILHARQLTRLSVWRLLAHLRKRSNICIRRTIYILLNYNSTERPTLSITFPYAIKAIFIFLLIRGFSDAAANSNTKNYPKIEK